MLDLVRNPTDRFSSIAAQILQQDANEKKMIMQNEFLESEYKISV